MITLLENTSLHSPMEFIDDNNKTVTIPNRNRSTLLVWKPERSLEGCASCAKKILPFVEMLDDNGIDVYGVSLGSVEQNAELSLFGFDNELRILSATIDQAKYFGVYREGIWSGIPHRAAFLIGPNGHIQKTWLITNPFQFRKQINSFIHTKDESDNKSLVHKILSKIDTRK